MIRLERIEMRTHMEVTGEPALWIQADFSNARHHAREVKRPWGAAEVSAALRNLAEQIARDPSLSDRKAAPTPTQGEDKCLKHHQIV